MVSIVKELHSYCKMILGSPYLKDKLVPFTDWADWDLSNEEVTKDEDSNHFLAGNIPAREQGIIMSDTKSKIPRLEHLNEPRNIGISLHHFANHELMAIELFAWGILKFPNAGRGIIRGFLKSMQEEQDHFRLYNSRMNELGVQFGDKPLNRLFWKQIEKMQTLEKFTAILSLSFEGANLDYTRIYKKALEFHGDFVTAGLIEKVYQDEIKHVKRGLAVFKHYLPEGLDDWSYFRSLLEYPFTPRRAKAYMFDPETRIKVGFSGHFVQMLGDFTDEYSGRVNMSSLEKVGI